jgi:hypothetical protein
MGSYHNNAQLGADHFGSAFSIAGNHFYDEKRGGRKWALPIRAYLPKA